MRTLYAFLCLAGPVLLGQTELLGEDLDRFAFAGEFAMPYYPSGKSSPCERPVWTGGAFVRCELDGVASPTVHSIDSTGQDSLVVFSLPGAKTIHINGIAHGRSNALAIVGAAFDDNGRIGQFVSWVSPDRKFINTLRTTGYAPRFVSIAPDGTIWTIGWETADQDNLASPLRPDAKAIRHYDSSIKLLDSFLPQRDIPRGNLSAFMGYLSSSVDRVGWYAGDGPYVEVTFANKKVAIYPGIMLHPHELILGLAVADNGAVLLNTSAYTGSRGFHLYELDRTREAWVSRQFPSDDAAGLKLWELLGSDGNTLVFRTSNPGRSRALTLR